MKSTAGFLGAIGVYSPDNRYDALFLSNYVDLYIRDALKRVPGVGNVIIFGERKFAMRLWLDPDKLASRSLTASDVVNALREQNVQVAAGTIGDEPSAADQMYQLSVRAVGRLSEVPQFENIVVKAGKDGALVRVKDIGRVELGAETYSANLRFGGLHAAGIGIQLLPSANAIEVLKGVVEQMNRLQANFPPGMTWQLAFDNVEVVQESIIEVLKTLAEAIGLVVLVMFIFLQNWRSTIIPAITIPVSLVGTFAFVKLFGFSINTLTLFGIVLATGIVVDDAIVVIENIERHMREEKKPAHGRGHRRDGRGVLGGRRHRPRAGRGLRAGGVFPGHDRPHVSAVLADDRVCRRAVGVQRGDVHAGALGAAPRKGVARGEPAVPAGQRRDQRRHAGVRPHPPCRAAVEMAHAAPVPGGVGRHVCHVSRVPGSFVPAEDEGYFIVILQAPPGASLEYTTNIAAQAEAIITKQPEVAAQFSVAGFSFSGASPNQGLMFVRLKGFDERRSAEHSLNAVLGRIRGQLFGIPGAIVVPVAPPAIQGLSTFGGFQFEVLDASGGDINNLAATTQQIAMKGNTSGKLAGLFSSFTANDPQLVVTIDRDRARSLGLPISEVTNALQVLVGSSYVNDFDFNNRAYRVYVQAEQSYRAQPSDLGRFYARASNGQMIPLSSVVTLSESTAPAVINHFNLFRSAEITGSGVPGVSSGQALQLMEQIAKSSLPAGFDFAWAGQSLEEIKAGSQAVYIFALSLVLVYLVLAALYESWVLPFVILLGVPLAVFGALSAQFLRGFSNDVFCQIGLVMLIGLAAKNSILIVEFAEQLRKHGHSILDAAIEAGRVRLRPILMTSFAFILGVMPLALATGAGAAARNSVGTAVAGGMLASTFLSIFFIPVLYVVIRTIAPGRQRVAEAIEVGGTHG